MLQKALFILCTTEQLQSLHFNSSAIRFPVFLQRVIQVFSYIPYFNDISVRCCTFLFCRIGGNMILERKQTAKSLPLTCVHF